MNPKYGRPQDPPVPIQYSEGQRTPKTRTYETPGECLKCGSMKHRIGWAENRDFAATLEDPSYRLYAICKVCTFWWTISAKDES